MSDRPVDILMDPVGSSRIDALIEWLLIGLLAFMPLAFGAVEAWSEMVVCIATGAMATLLVVRLFVGGLRLRWSWAYVPAGLFLVLAAVQLLPLPAGLVAAVSPHTAQVKSQLLGDLPDAASHLTYLTLSFYPLATQHDLRILLAMATIFVVVTNVYRRPEQVEKLLGAVAVIGGAIALLALAQVASGTDKIYWLVPTGHKSAEAGTFINHSHYSQFINLSIGAALGLLLVRLHVLFRGREVSLPAVFARLGDPDMRWAWVLAGVIVIGIASIFLSLSRGGMIALLIAGSFTAVMLAFKKGLKGRGWIIAVMALASFACVLYVGFDAVYERLATLSEDKQEGGRLQIIKDLSVSFTRFPTFGTGLGTHEVVYPMFDRSTIPVLAAHAENEYAQAAEETGLVGLLALLVFIALVWRSYGQCVRQILTPVRIAAFGLGFGLLAIMIQSFSDFGQHLPANAALTAVTCGLLVALSRMGQPAAAVPARSGSSAALWRAAGAFTLVGVLALWSWSLTTVNGARVAEGEWNQAQQMENSLAEAGWVGANDEYGELIQHARAALAAQPDNVKYRHWLNVYNWRAISRVRDPRTGQLVFKPERLKVTIPRIIEELHEARATCPTFGATYCLVGQLEYFILDQPIGAGHIRTGYQLAPCDATACFVAGLLDVHEGKLDDSLAKFARCLQLDGRLFRDVVDVYVLEVGRPDLAVALARDNIPWLLQTERVLRESAEHKELADKARAEAVTLLKAKCQQSDAPPWALADMANICRQDNDYASAADYYRRALAQNYGEVNWRLGLAESLAKTSQVSQAMHEARICLRLRPQMAAARKLIEDLSVLPGAPEENEEP